MSTIAATAPETEPPADAAGHPRFSALLCAGTVAATWLGLLAAVQGIRWGVVPSSVRRGDALDAAWVYVQFMLLLVWMILWPAIATSPRRLGTSRFRRRQLLWDLAAMIIGALPACVLAAFVSGTTPVAISATLTLQAGLAIMAFGALSCGTGRDGAKPLGTSAGDSLSVAFLAALAVAGPVIAYLWSEFFPLLPQKWSAAVPALALVRAAREPSTPVIWWIATGYALLGAALTLIAAALAHKAARRTGRPQPTG